LVAEMPKVADRAVLARPGVRRGRGGPGSGLSQTPLLGVGVGFFDDSKKPLTRPPKESDVVGSPKTLPLPSRKLNMDLLGQPTPNPLELLRVEAELKDVKRLGRTSELRVHGLVGAVGTALEEVREPTPGPIRKVRLVVDVVHAGPNRVLGRSPCRLRVEALVLVRAHAKDTLASGLEPLEVATLVKVPFSRMREL